jgi:hypothetical protein
LRAREGRAGTDLKLEGRQSSLDNVVQFGVDVHGHYPRDIEYAVNDVRALHDGLERLHEVSLGQGLIYELGANCWS